MSASPDAAAPMPPDREATPLTLEQFVAFLVREGRPLARKFLGWARCHGICRADARDAIHDVLLMVLRDIHAGTATLASIEPGRLFVSAMWRARRKHTRGQQVLPLDPDDGGAGPRRHRPEEVRAALLNAFGEALTSLGDQDRKVIELCDLCEQTLQDAAAQLDAQPRTVSRWRQRARERLGRALIAVLVRHGFDRAEIPRLPL